MDKNEIREIIAAALNEALTEKERQLAAAKAQAAVDVKLTQLAEVTASLEQKTAEITSLTASLDETKASCEAMASEKEAASAELETLRAELEALKSASEGFEASKAELTSKLEAVTSELTEAQTVASVMKERLDAIDAEALLASRMGALQTANVLRTGAALDAQKAKIVTLSDEEFSAYVEDLVALRNEIVASLKPAPGAPATAPVVTSELDLASTDKPDPSKFGEAISKLIMHNDNK